MEQRRRAALSSCLFSALSRAVTRTNFDPFQNSIIFLMTHKPIFRTQQGLLYVLPSSEQKPETPPLPARLKKVAVEESPHGLMSPDNAAVTGCKHIF